MFEESDSALNIAQFLQTFLTDSSKREMNLRKISTTESLIM